MNHPKNTLSVSVSSSAAMLGALLFLQCIVSGAERKAGVSPEAAQVQKIQACNLFVKEKLERLLGWELRDGKPKDVSPGMSQCDFTVPPKAYQTRRYDNPPLPEAAGFSSVVVTLFPTSAESFEQSRRTMGTQGGDISGIGDAAFLNGPAMIYVRVGNRGFSIRVHVETPKTDAGRTRLREVLSSVAREGVLRINAR